MQHEHPEETSGCGCCRRDFLTAVGAAAGGLTLSYTALSAAEQAGKSAAPKKDPATVRTAFIYPPSQRLHGKWWSWPGNDFDAEGRQAEYTRQVKQIAQELGIRISVDRAPLDSPAAAARFVGEVKQSDLDGLLLIPFHNPSFRLLDQILKEVKIPAVVFSCLGVKHGSVKGYKRPGVHLIQSLDNLEAVGYGMRMIKTVKLMRQSRIISVAGSTPKQAAVPGWGTQVRVVPIKRYVAEFDRVAVTEEVKALARTFRKNALKILEPAEPEIIAAARAHFANKRLLAAEGGDAIMMDCLRRGKLMPCMSFMTLRDEGIAAGCENDLSATLTLMLVQHLFDRPGFQHNPCFETEKNHYFASHCTSASKLLGTGGPQEPHLLRSFAHTNDPTCVPQVLWREGQDVTMAHYEPGEKPRMLVYSGKVVKSYAMPPVGGCRTNVEITVNELDDVCDVKGHHNVIFYGNHARRLRQFARFCGISAVT